MPAKRFPELLKHQTVEDRLASIAVEQESGWQLMRECHGNAMEKGRQNLNRLPPGPGDPVYLLTIIHEHRTRKVCYWHVMAEFRRLRLRFQKSC